MRLLGSRHRVVGVLTQPDRPKGRGRQLASSPVKLAALERGMPGLPAADAAGRRRIELICAAWQPDVLVVVAYGLILPPAALDLPRLGCVNIHASLLPRWRGAAPIQRAILAGDRADRRHHHAHGRGPGYRARSCCSGQCRSVRATPLPRCRNAWPRWAPAR